jgi:hypothetical protein
MLDKVVLQIKQIIRSECGYVKLKQICKPNQIATKWSISGLKRKKAAINPKVYKNRKVAFYSPMLNQMRFRWSAREKMV